VGAEGHGTDVPGMSAKGFQFLAGLYVPDLDRVLLTARRQAPAVGAERHVQKRSGDPGAVGEEAGFLLLVQAGRVPQFYDPVDTNRSQVPAVAAEHHPTDRHLVATERPDRLAGPRVPN